MRDKRSNDTKNSNDSLHDRPANKAKPLPTAGPSAEGAKSADADDAKRAELRQQGRVWARELEQAARAEGRPFGWFEALYARARARGEAGYVPWERAAPRFRLRAWLAEHPGHGRPAIDIGCGLGDNAACLSEAGWDVTAFDISETAVAWARQRCGERGAARVRFVVGDLFAPPEAWIGAFDLVHETYNLQAMPLERLEEAMAAIARLARPGGTVLVICRGRDEDEAPEGPPWPLARSQLAGFQRAGLKEVLFEEFLDERGPEPIRHFLVAYRA